MKAMKAGKGVEVREILISKIIGSVCRMRLEYDYEQEELGESIRECGVLNPIKVKPVKGGYMIFAGHRRLDRAIEQKRETVQAEIWRDIPDKEAALIGLVDNINRKDFTPLEEGYAYLKLVDDYGYRVDDLVKPCGKSRSRIYRLINLARNLTPRMKKAIIDGEMSAGHGLLLLKIEDVKLREKLFRKILAGDMDVSELMYYIQRQKPDSEKTKAELKIDLIEDIFEKDPGVQAIWNKALEVKRSRKGLKITLDVKDDDELLDIMKTISDPILRNRKR
jgi:ParB family chromosome partitioning protein